MVCQRCWKPLPRTASRGDQIENARLFADRGAGIWFDQAELSSEKLYRTIFDLLENRPRLEAMGGHARELVHPRAARDIAELIVNAMGAA